VSRPEERSTKEKNTDTKKQKKRNERSNEAKKRARERKKRVGHMNTERIWSHASWAARDRETHTSNNREESRNKTKREMNEATNRRSRGRESKCVGQNQHNEHGANMWSHA
jgi:hypothetical protein